MIEMPRRSVTRFFIPLIDVLTLLFCIFLLMPLVQATPDQENEPSAASAEEVQHLRDQVKQLRRQIAEPAELRADIDRLRQEKRAVLQERLAVRVLEIDADSGRLYYSNPERTEIRDEAEARALIERDQQAQEGSPRELYYLILYPRPRSSPYPLRNQRQRYEHWFRDVPHGWDVPGLGPGPQGSAP